MQTVRRIRGDRRRFVDGGLDGDGSAPPDRLAVFRDERQRPTDGSFALTRTRAIEARAADRAERERTGEAAVGIGADGEAAHVPAAAHGELAADAGGRIARRKQGRRADDRIGFAVAPTHRRDRLHQERRPHEIDDLARAFVVDGEAVL